MTDVDTEYAGSPPGYDGDPPKCPHGRRLWECYALCACGHMCKSHEHDVDLCSGELPKGQLDMNLQANMCPCTKFQEPTKQ